MTFTSPTSFCTSSFSTFFAGFGSTRANSASALAMISVKLALGGSDSMS